MIYQCQYCKGILKEIEQYANHKLFKCQCKNLRNHNWIVDISVMNKFYPVGYWMYIDWKDRFIRDKPLEYRFVFR